MGAIEEDHDDASDQFIKTKVMITVKKNDVLDFGRQLRYRFRDQKFRFEDAEKYLIEDLDQNAVSIEALT